MYFLLWLPILCTLRWQLKEIWGFFSHWLAFSPTWTNCNQLLLSVSLPHTARLVEKWCQGGTYPDPIRSRCTRWQAHHCRTAAATGRRWMGPWREFPLLLLFPLTVSFTLSFFFPYRFPLAFCSRCNRASAVLASLCLPSPRRVISRVRQWMCPIRSVPCTRLTFSNSPPSYL